MSLCWNIFRQTVKPLPHAHWLWQHTLLSCFNLYLTLLPFCGSPFFSCANQISHMYVCVLRDSENQHSCEFCSISFPFYFVSLPFDLPFVSSSYIFKPLRQEDNSVRYCIITRHMLELERIPAANLSFCFCYARAETNPSRHLAMSSAQDSQVSDWDGDNFSVRHLKHLNSSKTPS